MKHFYYGVWQEMYYYSWPTRFLFELLVALFLIFLVSKICRWIIKILGLKKIFVKIIVFLVTEFDALFGRNTTWAIAKDEKITEWGRNALEHPSKKWHAIKRLLQKTLIIVTFFCYILAVAPDLPIKNMIHPYYMQYLLNIKHQLQLVESMLSEGYEGYPPLFQKNKEIQQQKDSMDLKIKKKTKISIYKAPSIKAKVVGKIDQKNIIIYKDKCKQVKNRYWLKVYIPEKKITGWIDSRLVEEEQVQSIVKNDRHNQK